MEDLLKRLLDAEAGAEAEVNRASEERERMIREALEQARKAEQQFEDALPELAAPYRRQAEDRAAQAIAELRRKYDERQHRLRAVADQREPQAVAAALAVLLDPAQD